MFCVELVGKSAVEAHAEMSGGKEVVEDFYNNVVVIAGIGLVEVLGHSSSFEWAATIIE